MATFLLLPDNSTAINLDAIAHVQFYKKEDETICTVLFLSGEKQELDAADTVLLVEAMDLDSGAVAACAQEEEVEAPPQFVPPIMIP